MRSLPVVIVAGIALFAVASAAPLVPAADAARTRGERRARRPAAAIEGERVTSAFDCDTPRAMRAFGTRDRCLRALCERRDMTNAYVLDATERLRANPCAGLDPFDHR